MTEFTFSVTLENGANLVYRLQANEKLDAFSMIQSRFPNAINITLENDDTSEKA